MFLTPPRAFDLIVPWLLLTATIAIAGGRHASEWLARIARPGPRALMGAQAVLGIYGGYFGGGIGMMVTAAWGLLSGRNPAQLAAPRTLMLATANAAATMVFVATGMVAWAQCLPMLAGGYRRRVERRADRAQAACRTHPWLDAVADHGDDGGVLLSRLSGLIDPASWRFIRGGEVCSVSRWRHGVPPFPIGRDYARHRPVDRPASRSPASRDAGNELKLDLSMDQAFFESADRNHDDVLTPDEFAAEFRRQVNRAISAHSEANAKITPAKRDEIAEQMAGSMFRMLDVNLDQKLTYGELSKGGTRKQPAVT